MNDAVRDHQPLKQRDERLTWDTDRAEAGRTMVVIAMKI